MKRLLMFLGGLVVGIGLGIATAQLIAPMSGRELADEAQARLNALREEARRASEARRAELHAQLAEMTGGTVTLTTEEKKQAPAS